MGHVSSLLGLGLLVLLNVSLRVGQVASSRGVTTADGALLEVTLEDITSGKRIAAQDTHVRAVAGVCRNSRQYYRVCPTR